ncbi:DUF4832 domain-containing protein [Curtobacterium flaccumfaciens pv. oortii]|uniref:DUF4832 domain-containing protein n=1 Tax=Curtobacterium flaccumfaciens TaxID=2035 RepID=UPI001BDEC6D6|nr:DUF4832 domain-containing protein [Curtobacterium flaccumfaciens]MBT1624478.1 DUF4832 domain-containing protein [Curtobacterium flaccumfaciens pv. oortii]
MSKSHDITRRTALGLGIVATASAASGVLGSTPASAHSRAHPGAGAGPAGPGPGHPGRPHLAAAVEREFAADTTTVLRNPLNGWALYGSSAPPANYWTQYDDVPLPDGSTVTVSDHASVMYMRVSWTILEPSEGVYGWDTNAAFAGILAEARRRGLRLAFRVVVDSRDKSSDFTPAWVRAAGAAGYETQTGSKSVWSPYPDDPVFQAKYAAFVAAFGKQYDDPATTDFIDGYGLGKWGEGHSMLYQDAANREPVFDWIIDLYQEHFTRVPLALNYHRMIGGPKDWGTPDPESERMLDGAYEKGYVLRHDAFGMTTYYADWEKSMSAKWRYRRPIIMEGGWVTAQHDVTQDPRGYVTTADVRQGEFDDSVEAHVNMMDLRNGEALSWFAAQTSGLTQRFDAEGGYRLHPSRVVVPGSASAGATVDVTHEWTNTGWGYLPDNLPVWNGKYKAAVALLRADGSVAGTFVDTASDPSTWLKGSPTSYAFRPSLAGVAAGAYRWGIAIVDTTAGNAPGIELGAQGTQQAGWLVVGDVTIA